jgi:riboflavin kinase/FMN adenylyltransferase
VFGTLRGTVVAGDGRGRSLGFPTANLAVEEGAVPPEGVYAGWVRREGEVLPAAVSVGRRPTYYGEDGEALVEVHVLDFSGDLYGERVEVELAARLRGQERFSSTAELVAAIAGDVAAVRALVASAQDDDASRSRGPA